MKSPNNYKIMKFLKIFLSILVIVSIFIIGFFTYYVSDYVLPWDRAEVINTVQSWGGLSDLPKNATNFEYKKEGSIFTREFTVEFDAPKSEIENWILKSKGLQQKPSKIIKNTRIFEVRGYENSMGGKVYIKDNHVKINMMWS